ncbi:unnamed protein product [Ranitomeya imitator]|uniref:Ig-like domain-containing protein n=1 Tax=Ranitomeya imitator TaxID=111125 RepID=A0ABN9MC30_9NEOB|nr:unnamed protein product [Ranitomeya imitator]
MKSIEICVQGLFGTGKGKSNPLAREQQGLALAQIPQDCTKIHRLDVNSARIIVSPSQDIKEGEAVTLTCEVPGARPEDVHYSWFKNSILIKDSSVKSLNFPAVSTNVAGYYYCKVENEKGSDSSPTVIINVKYPPRIPSLSSFLETQRGSLAIIHCTVDSNPSSELTIYKDGNLIGNTSSHGAPGERVQVVPTVNSLSLKIQDVTLADEGLYSSAKLIVSPSGDIQEGNGVNLTCVLKTTMENGNYSYSWYKNNVPLMEESSGRLEIPQVYSLDSGFYYCKAWNNENSKSSAVVSLNVAYAPRHLQVLSFQDTAEGKSAFIRCAVDSFPSAEMSLYRGDQVVASSKSTVSMNSRYRVTSSHNELTVNIKNLKLEDEGKYNCTARNSIGSTTQSMYFHVQTARVLVSPSPDVLEGSQVTMTCDFMKSQLGETENIWYKNSRWLSKTTDNSLVFDNVKDRDSGYYHCVVQGAEDSSVSPSVFLHVSSTRVVISPSSVVEEGRAVNVTCAVDTDDESDAMYTWYKNGVKYSESSRNTVRFANVAGGEGGAFHCRVQSQRGTKISPAVILNVIYVHVLVSPSRDLREGHIVTLTCEVFLDETQEIISYIWYKNSRWLQDVKVSSFGLGKVSSHDAGSYSCAARTSKGSKTSPPVSLSVLYPPRNLSLTSFLELQGRQQGVILCTVDSNPPSQMHLLRGMKPLNSSSLQDITQRMKLSSTHNTLRLEIEDITAEDQGQYTCQAQNSLGNLEKIIQFTAESE